MGRVVAVAAIVLVSLAAIAWLAFGAKVRERERERERPVTASPHPPSPAPAPAPAASPAPTPDPFPRTLRGTVRDSATLSPIPKARVAARAGRSGAIRGVETDAAGRFAIPDLSPDRYEVAATAEGWLAGVPEARLVPGAAPLDLRLERGLAVRGRVVDDAGRAVTAGARVYVRLEIDAAAASNRYAGSFAPIGTDAEGRFEIPGVPPGDSYRLAVRAPAYAVTEVELLPVVAPGGLDGVVVTLRRLFITGDVALAPGVGSVVRRPGAIQVEVRRSQPPLGGDHGHGRLPGSVAWQPDWTHSLDEPGPFEVAVPLTGRFEVRARAQTEGLATPWTPVSVSAGTPGHASLVLDFPPPALPVNQPEPVPLRGRFFGLDGKPLAGTIVRLERPTDAATVERVVDPAGELEPWTLAPGEYQVTFREPATPELRVWRRALVVAAGAIAELEHAETAPRGSLEGYGPADGAAIVPARGALGAGSAFEFTSFVRPDETGRFVFAAVPPGAYTVLRPGAEPVEVKVVSGAVTVVPALPPR